MSLRRSTKCLRQLMQSPFLTVFLLPRLFPLLFLFKNMLNKITIFYLSTCTLLLRIGVHFLKCPTVMESLWLLIRHREVLILFPFLYQFITIIYKRVICFGRNQFIFFLITKQIFKAFHVLDDLFTLLLFFKMFDCG